MSIYALWCFIATLWSFQSNITATENAYSYFQAIKLSFNHLTPNDLIESTRRKAKHKFKLQRIDVINGNMFDTSYLYRSSVAQHNDFDTFTKTANFRKI